MAARHRLETIRNHLRSSEIPALVTDEQPSIPIKRCVFIFFFRMVSHVIFCYDEQTGCPQMERLGLSGLTF